MQCRLNAVQTNLLQTFPVTPLCILKAFNLQLLKKLLTLNQLSMKGRGLHVVKSQDTQYLRVYLSGAVSLLYPQKLY